MINCICTFRLEDELKCLRENNKEQAASYTKLESEQVKKFHMTVCQRRRSECFLEACGEIRKTVTCLQNDLSKAKDGLEAEKRELVRTLERRSQEMEHQSGI